MGDRKPLSVAKHLEWYGEKWWQEDQYRGFLPNVTAEQVDAAIARVARVFDSKWMARAEPHPAWVFLGPHGTFPLECLVELGSDLLDVDGVLRLPSVIHDLRVPSHFESTRLELRLAALLRREGYDLEFRPSLPNCREADLAVKDGDQRVFLEVKRLLESEAQTSTSRLSMAIIVAVGDLLRTKPWVDIPGMSYEIELSDSIGDLMRAGPVSDRVTIQGLTSGVVAELKARLEHQTPPFEYEVARLVRVRIGHNLRAGLSGPRLDPVADLKRALRKFLHNAGRQLHPEHPGILVCQTGSFLDAAITRIRLEPLLASQEHARHVNAAVFLPVYTSLPERFPIFPPFVVFNPCAAFATQDLSVYQTLSRHFGIIE